MIIDDGKRAVSVVSDEESARYTSVGQLHGARPAKATPTGAEAIRAVVEVRRRQGGMSPRALIGGRFEPRESGEVTIDVLVSDTPLGLGQPATCASNLGTPLVPGLPDEFGSAALTGLTSGGLEVALPPGVLTVDRAGYDEVESASQIFELAATLLLEVIAARISGADLASVIRSATTAWP
jgi:hypothetical protein